MNVYWELSHSSEANSSQKNQRGKIAIWRYDEQRVLFAPAAPSDARHISPPKVRVTLYPDREPSIASPNKGAKSGPLLSPLRPAEDAAYRREPD